MVEISVTHDNDRTIVRPNGDIVAASVSDLRSRMNGLIGEGAREMALDLSGVQALDSAGIGLLVAAHNSLLKLGGHLTVIHASSDILELLQAMRIHKHIPVSAD